ncbi:sensor histidine kinase [Nitrincola alkalisediminis]|uniref:sensor histidine kinase n=1 Tax=Nitrincola alkalisediminis TaxID=1366656 RepID=UPI00187465DF|nr:ATP-binding protein [Nitrincola alkalisediminis]
MMHSSTGQMIKFRVLVWVAVFIISSLGLLIFFALDQSQKNANKVIKMAEYSIGGHVNEQLQATAQALSEEIKSLLQYGFEPPFVVSSILASASGWEFPMQRRDARDMLKSVLAAHPNVESIYAHFEPNAFDGLDSFHRLDPQTSSREGTFELYWVRDNHSIVFVPTPDPSIKYDSTLDRFGIRKAEWYLCPLETKQFCITDPYYWETFPGAPVLMVSLTFPVIKDEQFIGIAGADINVSTLQQKVLQLSRTIFDGDAQVTLLTQNDRIIASNHFDGQLGEFIDLGEEGLVLDLEEQSSNGFILLRMPLLFANVHWTLVIKVPSEKVYGSVVELTDRIHVNHLNTQIKLAIAAVVIMVVSLLIGVSFVRSRENITQQLNETLIALKRTQEELIQSEKLASLGGLVAGVAHELNTPIGNAVMAASTLKSDVKTFNQEMEQGLKRSSLTQFIGNADEASLIILRNLEKASSLITGFKQVAVDQTSLNKRTFCITEVLDEVMLMLNPTLKRSLHRVEIDVIDKVVMTSYPGPLGQVLINLVQNALVHAFDETPGVIKIRVEKSKKYPRMVDILVNDNGKGISDNHLKRIFDPFFTTNMGGGGTGLGLSIVHNSVVGILAGKIDVISQRQQGSTFTISIPIKVI